MFDENKLFDSLAEANNNRDYLTYKILSECLSNIFYERMPIKMFPYEDITGKEIKELILLDKGSRIKQLPKTSWWGRLWK
jgi:hypothetical protein